MSYEIKRKRDITIYESKILNEIEGLLGENATQKLLILVKIKSATEDGFFEKLLKASFDGFNSQNDELREKAATLSTALSMSVISIPESKIKQKKFKETFRHSILKGLNIAKSYFNIDDQIERLSKK